MIPPIAVFKLPGFITQSYMETYASGGHYSVDNRRLFAMQNSNALMRWSRKNNYDEIEGFGRANFCKIPEAAGGGKNFGILVEIVDGNHNPRRYGRGVGRVLSGVLRDKAFENNGRSLENALQLFRDILASLPSSDEWVNPLLREIYNQILYLTCKEFRDYQTAYRLWHEIEDRGLSTTRGLINVWQVYCEALQWKTRSSYTASIPSLEFQ